MPSGAGGLHKISLFFSLPKTSLFKQVAIASILFFCCVIFFADQAQRARPSNFPVRFDWHAPESVPIRQAVPISAVVVPIFYKLKHSTGEFLRTGSDGKRPHVSALLRGQAPPIHTRPLGPRVSSVNSVIKTSTTLKENLSLSENNSTISTVETYWKRGLQSETGALFPLRRKPTNSEHQVPQAKAATFPPFRASDKYLFYPRAGDWCKGSSHNTWSLSCGLGDALYLNRTYVLDMQYCVHEAHNDGKVAENDIRLYYDVARMQSRVELIPRETFLAGWREHEEDHLKDQITVKHIPWLSPSPPLRNDPATIIQRTADDYSDIYAFEVCDVKENSVIERPWAAVWGFSPPLMDMAYTIAGALQWEYDAVHVRRGDKLTNSTAWPNLDRDTQPARILEVLRQRIMPGRRVYIATNEYTQDFFKPLDAHYNISILSDFSHLWSPGSNWWKACKETLGPEANTSSLEFDGVMKGMVDSVVFSKAAVQIETFNDLTSDPKHGLGKRYQGVL